MSYLIIIIALSTVIGYARMLYNEDERMKYRRLDGDWTGFECFYYCSPSDIIEYEKHFNENERVCTELYNYKIYKL